MSRRTGPNSGPHCQGSWQQTSIVGQGKEFGYIFQQGPQLQTNQSNRLLSKPFCLHSNLPPSLLAAVSVFGHSLPPEWTPEEAEGGNHRIQECKGSGWKLKMKLCYPAEIQPHTGLRMLLVALSHLEWEFSKQSRLCVVLLQPLKLLKPSIYLWWDVQRSSQWKENTDGAAINRFRIIPQTAAFTVCNTACHQRNMISSRYWWKIFFFHLHHVVQAPVWTAF